MVVAVAGAGAACGRGCGSGGDGGAGGGGSGGGGGGGSSGGFPAGLRALELGVLVVLPWSPSDRGHPGYRDAHRSAGGAGVRAACS